MQGLRESETHPALADELNGLRGIATRLGDTHRAGLTEHYNLVGHLRERVVGGALVHVLGRLFCRLFRFLAFFLFLLKEMP